jgi:WD40 repeat protein
MKTKSTLTCIETLTPPFLSKTHKSISKADELLSSYSSSKSTSAPSPVWNCTWSHDGTVLATCHGRPNPCIRLWKYKWHNDNDVENTNPKSNWTLMATLREEGDDDNSTEARTIRSVAFAPTPMNVRGILAVASFDGTI